MIVKSKMNTLIHLSLCRCWGCWAYWGKEFKFFTCVCMTDYTLQRSPSMSSLWFELHKNTFEGELERLHSFGSEQYWTLYIMLARERWKQIAWNKILTNFTNQNDVSIKGHERHACRTGRSRSKIIHSIVNVLIIIEWHVIINVITCGSFPLCFGIFGQSV